MTPLEKYRSEHPQYKDVPDDQLADALYKKYYSTIPRDQFEAKIGIKAADIAPVAMEDPGFFGRIDQRAEQFNRGKQAPILPQDAGTGARIADTVMDAHDTLGNLTNLLARGFTFGLSDDAAALGTATAKAAKGHGIKDVMEASIRGEGSPSFAGDFMAANAFENEKMRQFKEAHPIAGNAAEVAGMLTNPGNAAGAGFVAKGGNIASRAARAAIPGAGLGFLTGAGYAEGDLGDRATGGGAGAVAGFILAPLASGGTELLLNLGGRIYSLGKNVISANQDPVAQANRLLAQAIARDEIDPAALQAVAGNDVDGIINAGGTKQAPNLTALGRQATVAPGNARNMAADFIEEQQAGQVSRTADSIRNFVPENADDEIARLADAKRTAAKPLYEAAHAADPESLNTSYVQDVLQSPIGKSALANAKKLWEADRLAGRVQGDPFTSVLDAEGNLTLQTAPDMRILDYMKRGMDQSVDEAFKRSATEGQSLKAVRDAFRNHLREINPKYGEALDAYSGPSHTQDLMNEGMDFLKGRAQDKINRIAKLKDEDLSAYRIGAVRAYLDKLDKVIDAGDVYAAMANNQEKRKLLAALFPNRADFDAIANQLLTERARVSTARGVSGNSVTSRLDAEKSDAADTTGLIRTALDMAGGNYTGGLIGLITNAGNKARGITEPVANELGRLLFSADPATKQAILQGLIGAGGKPGLLQQTTQQVARQGLIQRGAGQFMRQLAGPSAGAVAGSVR